MVHVRSWVYRAGVAVALVVALGASALSLPHGGGADDSACNPVAVAHDPSAHHVGPGRTLQQSDADHCFICHTLRSFCSSFDKFDHHDPTPRIQPLHAAQVDHPALVAWTLVPGRAPPA